MEIAMTVDRIKNLMKTQGFKIGFVCAQLGVNNSYFNDCKKKNIAIPDDRLHKIAVMLGTSVEYLTGETNDPEFDISTVGLKAIPYDHRGSRPVFGKASAGLGVLAQQEVLGYEPVSADHDTDEYFWLRVSGDSMSPVLVNGDLVLVQRDAPVESGAVMVVIVDDEEGFIKKVITLDDTITLHSYNPTYMPMVYGGAEIARLRFVGRVVEMKRTF